MKKIELHLLQSFAPSCLNRDDTGAPKDCEFGGVRRARVSSQAWKRAIRQAFSQLDLVPEGQRAVRTKRIVEALSARVATKRGKGTAEEVAPVVQRALEAAGLGVKDGKTEYLLFLPQGCVDRIAGLVVENWDQLAEAVEPAANGEEGKGKAKKKKGDAGSLSKELVEKLQAELASARAAPEIALFGRMIADKPAWNVDAACQVAHAISTHRVSMEFDFYTAVDDLKADDSSGADMMGTVQFNSACFYRYLVVDVDELIRNLGGKDDESVKAARDAVVAFLRAAILAIPAAKQNSMAAQNLPSFVAAVVRDGGAPWSLANAFLKPVRATEGDGDLMKASISALDRHIGSLAGMYGVKGVREIAWAALDAPASLENLGGGDASTLRNADGRSLVRHAGDIESLVASVTGAAFGDLA